MILIVDQVYIFLYAILCGSILAFFYDILRIKRRIVKTSTAVVNAEDTIYWIAASVFVFISVFKSNNGQMRGYIFIGNIIGFVLYQALLSKTVISSSVVIINITKRVMIFLFKVVSYPIILIYKALKVPICLALKIVKKLARLNSNRIRILIERVGILFDIAQKRVRNKFSLFNKKRRVNRKSKEKKNDNTVNTRREKIKT